MSSTEIDEYLARVPESRRVILQALRATIRKAVPEAKECISYKVPAFRIDGHVVGGFANFSSHMSYLPFSGSVLSTLDDSLEGHPRTKSALHFTESSPLSSALVAKLLQTRLAEIADRGH